MKNKEELARQYAEKKVRESPANLYKGYHLHRQMELTRFDGYDVEQAFGDGFDEAALMLSSLWKDGQGDDLPAYDREVVVLGERFPGIGEYMVAIGWRPDPDGYDTVGFTGGRVPHVSVTAYDRGGWCMPCVRYWLDIALPGRGQVSSEGKG